MNKIVINVLKKKNGVTLLQYPSGTYGIEHSNADYGYGMKYTDNKKEAINFFKKVSADTSPKSLSAIRKQNSKQQTTKRNFTIKYW